jgi:hypothetical protein
VFLSKIWMFLITLGAAIALTIALTLPRPAQRTLVNEEQNRLSVACGVIDILLADDARNRVELAGSFSRAPEVVAALEAASNANTLDEQRMKQVRDVGENLMKGIQGRKPDFAMLIDRRGRVVARVRLDENDFGDVYAGRPLVDDALAGYLRDDLWAQNGTMYFVSASPVVKRDPPVAYAGAVVIGHKITNELAQKLVSSLDVDVGFFLDNLDVASSKTIALDHAPLLDVLKTLKGNDLTRDCQVNHPLDLHAGTEDYTAVVARLPGEAQLRQAFYTVLIKRPESRGFAGTLKIVSQSDLSFKNFPWILVGAGFLVALGIGIALMMVEADRPLKRLAKDAVALAKGEKERLSEEAHGGKFGSIARSVNIHIDKLGREAKSARTNLDQLLGPAPEGSLGTIDLLAGGLPPVRPGGQAPMSAPAPSDFKFHDAPPAQVNVRTPAVPQRVAQPPSAPVRMQTAPAAVAPPPPRLSAPPPMSLDDDILDGAQTMQAEPSTASGAAYFKQVFDQFIAVKKSCNEQTSGLTLQKFSEKLVKNRDDLMAKTGCREVRFTVYVKDGKAALKATPVKDE